MKTTMKKILSFVLVAMMIVSALPFSAFAAEEAAHVHCPNCDGEDVDRVGNVVADCLTSGGDVYLCNKCEKNFITNFVAPLGHDYSVKVKDAVEGDGKCGGDQGYTAVMKCFRCDATTGGVATEKTEHTWDVWTTVVPAVCGVSNGVSRRTCKDCDVFEEEPIAADTHNLVHNTARDEKVDCDKAGEKDGYIYLECQNAGCNYEKKVVAYDYNHSDEYYNGGVVTTKPLCGVDGVLTFTCADCGATRTEAIPALEHKWDKGVIDPDSTCTALGVKTYTCANENCPVGTKTEDVNLKIHTLEHHDEVKGTCTTTGTKEYWYCTVCKQFFLDAACTIAVAEADLVVYGEVIDGVYSDDTKKDFHHNWLDPKLSDGETCGAYDYITYGCKDCDVWVVVATLDLHKLDLKKTDADPEDCFDAGNSEYWYCEGCKKYFSDAEGTVEIEKDSWVIAPKAHKNATFVPASAETCGAAGNNAYYACADCGKYFSDEACKNEIAVDSWIIPATGKHEYKDYTITTKPTCSVEGFETGKCVCGAEDTRNIGYAADVHNFDFEGAKVLYAAEDCANNKKAVYTYTCTDCGVATMNRVADNFVHDFSDVEIGKDYKQATCTEDGYYVQICRQCHNAYNTVVIPAIGHDYDADQDGVIDWVVDKAPTCEEDGKKIAACKNGCGHNAEEAILALGHEITLDFSKPNMGASKVEAATCISTEKWYFYCPRCEGDVLVIDKADSYIDHVWADKGEVTTAATCTEMGYTTYKCTVDGCTATKTVQDVPVIKHTLVHHKAVADTCTTVGNIEYWQCSVCNKLFSDADAKTEITSTEDNKYADHNHQVNNLIARKADCVLYGYVYYACTVCGDDYIVTYRPLGHNIVKDEAKAPTCTETGLTEGSHCSRCDDMTVKQNEIPATGHKNANGDVLTDICTDPKNAAVEDRHCVACGKDIVIVHKNQSTFKVDANCCDFEYNLTQCDDCLKVLKKEVTGDKYGDHIKSKNYVVDKEATCTEAGAGHYVCTRCDAKLDDVVIPAGNHKWGSWTTTVKATCEAAGTKTRTCSVCKTAETETIKALGHKFTVEKSYVAPTYTTKGERVWECANKCGKTQTDVIDALKGINFVMDYYNGNAEGKFVGNKDIYVVNGGIVTVKIYLQAWEEAATNLKLTFNYKAADLTFIGASDTGIFDHTIVTGKGGVLTIYSYNDDSSNETIKTQGKDAKVEYVTLNFKVATLDNLFAGDTSAYYDTAFTNFASEAYKVDADKTLATTTVAHANEEIHIHKLGAINAEHEGTVDGADHIALMGLIKAGKYLAEADIDMDGDVDTMDYLYLAQYNANVYTYAEFVGISG